MSDVAVNARGLGKRYQYGGAARYETLRDRIVELSRNPSALFFGTPAPETFWALKDVSFEVRRGEVVGIIGRNGAGKSTLLKILSRITEPTQGEADIRGRVGSLLEVGTGFHPELTGRENVLLNGAILGMRRADILRKFDEIVAFAEVANFIDTAVKHYSSGMYMRLAFAVAAHLEPEILVVDEVLAVGDASFQRKCLGKMGDVARGGRTVLFVSHNIQAVQMLCTTAIHLRGGSVVAKGPVHEVISGYLRESETAPAVQTAARRLGDDLELTGLSITPNVVASGGEATIRVALRAPEKTTLFDATVLLYNQLDARIAVIDLRTSSGPTRMAAGGVLTVETRVRLPLVEATYKLGLFLRTDRTTGDFVDLETFEVVPSGAPREVLPYQAAYRGVLELDATAPRYALTDPTPSLTIQDTQGGTS
jgi:lipopolysaccharide transport system ATP-binding protein